MLTAQRCGGFRLPWAALQRRFTSTDDKHPFKKAVDAVGGDFLHLRDQVTGRTPFSQSKQIFPHYCDVLIVGGGVMGYSTAYWLQQRVHDNMRIVVVEKDPTVNPSKSSWLQYQKSTSTLSVGGLRQQFSLKENIELSLASAEFLRNIKHHLGVEGSEPPNVAFNPCGYLFLASEKGRDILQSNYELQRSLGAKVELLSPDKLKRKFPFMNTEGIELGVHGLENEGWFDPWSLLNAFKSKALSLGVEQVGGEVKSFNYNKSTTISSRYFGPGEYPHIESANVLLSDGTTKKINFSKLIIAAGADSGQIGSLVGMGTGTGPLRAPLPIEPRKRFVYVMHCPDGPGLAAPFIIDPTGAYVRREGLGGHYLCGISPSPDETEPDCDNMDVNYEFFENRVWPIIAHRVPAFEKAKLKNAWAGFYDFNSFDENAFIGPHPAFHNIFVVAGFSGHGIQQSPAVGRAMMEMIIDGEFQTIDLSRLGMDRFMIDEPLYESNIV